MAKHGAKVRLHYRTLYEEARTGVKQNPDGSCFERDMLDALTRLLLDHSDPQAEARRRAKQIIDTLARVPGEMPERDDDDEDEDEDEHPGQLWLQIPGINERVRYDPRRLVRDTQGNIIEEDKQTLAFAVADHSRSTENMARVALWNTRKGKMLSYFQRWVLEQMQRGRTSRLTWGDCIRETGALGEGDAL